MAETIEYEQFKQDAQPANGVADLDLSRLSDIPMALSVEIGRTHMTVGETLDLRVGSVVTLERLSGEAADLLVNGSAIARGEVVVIDEQYGLRVTEILDVHADAGADAAPSLDGELATPGAPSPADASGEADGEGPAADTSAAGDADGALAQEG